MTNTKHKPATAEITQGSVEGAIYVRLPDQGGYAAEFYGHNAQRNAKRLLNYPQLVAALRALLDTSVVPTYMQVEGAAVADRAHDLLRAIGELE